MFQLGLPHSCLCIVPSDARYDITDAIDVGSLRILMEAHKVSGRTPLIVFAFAGKAYLSNVLYFELVLHVASRKRLS